MLFILDVVRNWYYSLVGAMREKQYYVIYMRWDYFEKHSLYSCKCDKLFEAALLT